MGYLYDNPYQLWHINCEWRTVALGLMPLRLPSPVGNGPHGTVFLGPYVISRVLTSRLGPTLRLSLSLSLSLSLLGPTLTLYVRVKTLCSS